MELPREVRGGASPSRDFNRPFLCTMETPGDRTTARAAPRTSKSAPNSRRVPNQPTEPAPRSDLRRRPVARNFGQDERSKALAASIAAHQRVVSAHEAAMIAEIAEFDGAEAWRGDGAFSMRDWLVAHCHVGSGRARTLVKAAATSGTHPRLHETLSKGAITLDVLDPLLEVATEANDAELAEAAVEWTPRKAREYATEVRGTNREEAQRQFKDRFVRFDDARCSLWAQLPKDMYGAVKSAITGRARLYTHPSASDPDYETFENRCADALHALALEGGRRRPTRSGAGAGESAGESGGGKPFGGSKTTVVVHIDLERLLGGDEFGTASIEGVGPISTEMARRLACDAETILSFEGPEGNILDQKKLRRDPTAAQRIEIGRRDNGCRFPGCPCHNITDVHHVIWASKQGETALSNLLTLCVAHHSRVHELGWTIDGDANAEVRFTSPTGKTLVSVPSPGWRRNLRSRK